MKINAEELQEEGKRSDAESGISERSSETKSNQKGAQKDREREERHC